MDFLEGLNANLSLSLAKYYLTNRSFQPLVAVYLQTRWDNLLHTTDWFSAIIIFYGKNSLIVVSQNQSRCEPWILVIFSLRISLCLLSMYINSSGVDGLKLLSQQWSNLDEKINHN